MASNLTAAIERQEPTTPVALLQSEQALTMISESLPAGMDAKTFQRHAITLVKQNPDLLACEAASVAQGIVRGAALGLDPDPALGQMWLVPRNVKDGQTWSKVATFQVGWRGLYELAMRTGRVAKIEVKAVHRNDRFEARLGSKGGLVHEPDWFGDRGPVIGWYAYAQLRDGTEMFEVLSLADAEAHRDAHASTKTREGRIYGPWADHFDAMAAKTVFLKLAKWLPKQVERGDAFAQALEADGQAVRTPLGGMPGHGDVIEATYTPDPVPAGALPEPTTPEPTPEPELVDDEPEGDLVPLADENGDPIVTTGAPKVSTAARNRKMHAMVAEAWPDLDADGREKRRKALVAIVGDGAESSKALTDTGWDDLFLALDEIAAGRSELHLKASGEFELRSKR
jgi:recombination protein RecT